MKIYSRSFSQQYANIAKGQPPLQVPANMMQCFQIQFPSEGILDGFTVNQVSTDATKYAATIELLDSQIPYPPGSYANNAAPVMAIEHFRVIPDGITLLAGGVVSLSDDNYGLGFRNIDGGFTLNQRYLYVLINPVGNGSVSNWNLTILCRTDVG